MKDTKEGLFGKPPTVFLLAFAALMSLFSVAVDRLVLIGTNGDANVTLQIAGVFLINAGVIELARIDSGEKTVSREDAERKDTWRGEFEGFAVEKIAVSSAGSCHKSDVVRAYRRFYSKYRTEEAEGSPTDLDIFYLFAEWNLSKGTRVKPSSAGFVKGLIVKEDSLMT